MKRTPLKRKRTTPRRTTSPRCSTQRCNSRAEVRGLCVSHAMKRADSLMSRFVRDRDRGCTAADVLFETECEGALQAAHVVGRNNYAVRYDPVNVHALCQAHHMLVDQTGREAQKYTWASWIIGQSGYSVLMDTARRSELKRRASIEQALEWLEEESS